MSLQEKLAALRKAQKLSQDEVAEQLNVTRQAISRWESGKSLPSTENLIAIAGLFQVPLQALIEPEQSFDAAAEYKPEGLRAGEAPACTQRRRAPGAWMQTIVSLCILVLLAFTAGGVYTLLGRDAAVGTAAQPVDSLTAAEPEFGIALVNDGNRDQIGQEAVGTWDGQFTAPRSGSIISFVENNEVFLPAMIQEVKTQGKKTPELMAPNGVMGIFTREDGGGWHLSAGETLHWDFEKYPFSDGRHQALAVGHIKNGMLCQSTLYQREETGCYRVQADEEGVYYIYFICCSSDSISLKEGTIGIKKW